MVWPAGSVSVAVLHAWHLPARSVLRAILDESSTKQPHGNGPMRLVVVTQLGRSSIDTQAVGDVWAARGSNPEPAD
jgi:hypothetical protein